jgi:hypothetical protein
VDRKRVIWLRRTCTDDCLRLVRSTRESKRGGGWALTSEKTWSERVALKIVLVRTSSKWPRQCRGE